MRFRLPDRGVAPLVLAAAAAATAALVQAPHASAAALRGQVSYATFASKALRGTVGYSVYLPPGYATSGLRYPVVYFLHGLPATSSSYRSIAQVAAAVEASGHQAIVIGAEGARAGETDPEWRNWGPGRNWETATATELVATVDANYRTIASRAGRVIVGVSAGGYGATLIALHHPNEYGAVESWSGYFHATTPDGAAALELGSPEADDWANAHKLLPAARRFLSAEGPKTYFAFYVGTNDALFREENLEFAAELRGAGIPQAVFHLYPGGHDWTLWGSHATGWLGTALAAAAKPA